MAQACGAPRETRNSGAGQVEVWGTEPGWGGMSAAEENDCCPSSPLPPPLTYEEPCGLNPALGGWGELDT